MALNKGYQILWIVLNGIIFIYGLIVLIYAKCCNNKKKYIHNVILYYFFNIFIFFNLAR